MFEQLDIRKIKNVFIMKIIPIYIDVTKNRWPKNQFFISKESFKFQHCNFQIETFTI